MVDSHIVLCGVSPTVEGLRWESDRRLRVGRFENQEVLLDDRSVSRRHAEVILGPDGWGVVDLGSSNGTFLNGVRVGRTLQKIRQHDILQIGELYLTVETLREEAVNKPSPSCNIRTTGSFVTLKAVTQSPWDEAVKLLGDQADQHLNKDKGFLTLLRAGRHLCQIASLDDMLRSVLSETVAVLNARRGWVILMDEAADQLQLRAVAPPLPKWSPASGFSKTLAERCFLQGHSLLCMDGEAETEMTRDRSWLKQRSSIICALLRSPRKRLGVLILDRDLTQAPFSQSDCALADAIAATISTGIESAQLIELQRTQTIQMVTALAQAVELRDQYTAGHTYRVTTYALMLADALNLTESEQHLLRIGTPLHDLGKIGVSDSVLLKRGQLTSAEFEHMKTHTVKGAQILEAMPHFTDLIPIIRNHHEHWDGRGYPDGLAQDCIPSLARIVTIADAFDAMTSDRPYRPALSVPQAYGELNRQAGKQFDPGLVAAFSGLRQQCEALISQEESQKRDTNTMAETMTLAELARAAS